MKQGLFVGIKGFHHYENDELHKEDGPAIETFDGHKFWYRHGKLHRIDGPAIVYSTGYSYWYFNGEKISCKSNEEFLRLIKLKVFL